MDHGHSMERVIDPEFTPPKVTYGRNLISEITDTDESYAVITMDIPWDLARESVTKPPAHVSFVQDMHLKSLEILEAEVPDVDLVIGLGGGSSHDSAKYIAIKKNARLVSIRLHREKHSLLCFLAKPACL